MFADSILRILVKSVFCMKSNSVHNISTIRECETFTMNSTGITSLLLMESAGIACTEHIISIIQLYSICDVFIFCGTGNNGGDGAVIARQLIYKFNFSHNVTLVNCSDNTSKRSKENSYNIELWKDITAHHTNAHYIDIENFNFSIVKQNDLIIDSLFGIGLTRQLAGLYAEIVENINKTNVFVVSIDIPSGLYVDSHTPSNNNVVIANITLTIQFAKLGLLLPENYKYFGRVEIIDIGIEEPLELLEKAKIKLVDRLTFGNDWNNYYQYAHKGSYGHGFLIAGSSTMPGATILSATAAMRGGLGKLTVHSTKEVLSIMTSSLPEAIYDIDEDKNCVSKINWDSLPKNITAIAIGPGLGNSKKTESAIKDTLDTVTSPIILDADALNFLAKNKTRLAYLPKNSILTPHFKEFERLVGKVENDFERVKKAREFATRYSVILILKGYNTLISMPDGFQFFNTTGNPGMATAGSGDVLTGLLLSLLAQGFNPQFAALLGVYIHGAAGDAYTSEHSYKTLIASDIYKYFDKAFNNLLFSESKPK